MRELEDLEEVFRVEYYVTKKDREHKDVKLINPDGRYCKYPYRQCSGVLADRDRRIHSGNRNDLLERSCVWEGQERSPDSYCIYTCKLFRLGVGSKVEIYNKTPKEAVLIDTLEHLAYAVVMVDEFFSDFPKKKQEEQPYATCIVYKKIQREIDITQQLII
ncbi:MAG: hypothetical protein KAT28_03870 [Candidatus Aenigmarchaeota archaeon]|nr:hypothetical protein [Candidatus Aenigmarchaeota archaeon]